MLQSLVCARVSARVSARVLSILLCCASAAREDVFDTDAGSGESSIVFGDSEMDGVICDTRRGVERQDGTRQGPSAVLDMCAYEVETTNIG